MYPPNNILAVDVGSIRVGVALTRAGISIPVALKTLSRAEADFWQQLLNLIQEHDVGQLVIGLPRGLDGQETAQTGLVRAFGQELATHTTLPIEWQDEALTSVKAETTLKNSAKPYNKADIDALAACYILEDYLNSRPVGVQK